MSCCLQSRTHLSGFFMGAIDQPTVHSVSIRFSLPLLIFLWFTVFTSKNFMFSFFFFPFKLGFAYKSHSYCSIFNNFWVIIERKIYPNILLSFSCFQFWRVSSCNYWKLLKSALLNKAPLINNCKESRETNTVESVISWSS